MIETPQEYTARILGYIEGSEPLKVIESTPRRLKKLLKGATRQKLSKRPDPTHWSVTEILAHLADSELVMGFRMRLVLGSNGVTIQGFDQDVWAEFSHYAKQDPRVSLNSFLAERERTIRLLKQVPAELWENYGMHTERGMETLHRIAGMMAGHDVNHLRQIEQTLPSTNKRGAKATKTSARRKHRSR